MTGGPEILLVKFFKLFFQLPGVLDARLKVLMTPRDAPRVHALPRPQFEPKVPAAAGIDPTFWPFSDPL